MNMNPEQTETATIPAAVAVNMEVDTSAAVSDDNNTSVVTQVMTVTATAAAADVGVTIKPEAGVETQSSGIVESSSSSSSSNGSAPSAGVTAPVETDQAILNLIQGIKDDTEDADDVQESEHWDTRQSFLNLCQGNHYQYDQLRRAKHSSLLVLYLMHNPDAPKFLASCAYCHKEIVSGVRRRCDQCDVDYCDACIGQCTAQRLHPQHYLRPMPVAGAAPVQQITAQERLDRQNALRLHLQLLFHAAYCDDATTCKAKNCSKMKVSVFYCYFCLPTSVYMEYIIRFNYLILTHLFYLHMLHNHQH
jgi:hypothetical protein